MGQFCFQCNDSFTTHSPDDIDIACISAHADAVGRQTARLARQYAAKVVLAHLSTEPEFLSLNSIADTTSASRLFLCAFPASALQNSSSASTTEGHNDSADLVTRHFRSLKVLQAFRKLFLPFLLEVAVRFPNCLENAADF